MGLNEQSESIREICSGGNLFWLREPGSKGRRGELAARRPMRCIWAPLGWDVHQGTAAPRISRD